MVKVFLKLVHLLVWLGVIEVCDSTHNVNHYTTKSIDDAIFPRSAPLWSPGFYSKLLMLILQICLYRSVCMFYISIIFPKLFVLESWKPTESSKNYAINTCKPWFVAWIAQLIYLSPFGVWWAIWKINYREHDTSILNILVCFSYDKNAWHWLCWTVQACLLVECFTWICQKVSSWLYSG